MRHLQKSRASFPLPCAVLLALLGFLHPQCRSVHEPEAPGSFLHSQAVGFAPNDHPRIASVVSSDLDRDGLMDILACDMQSNRIGWIRQTSPGVFQEQWVGPEIKAPARVQAFDIDQDGGLDLLVASMGELLPTNEKIGSVLILENDGNQKFASHVIAGGIARVTDVRGGDFNGDGRMDLIVAQFGYHQGETRWMENLGGWQFRSHILQRLSGPIHAIPADMDGDGDLDIVSLVSQEWEEIYLFENDGRGNFQYRVIFGSTNEDYGSSGMAVVDLDRDGDLDVLFTNGDAFDSLPPRPKPWHSVQWLENRGNLYFEYHRIGHFPGASSACAADVDNDGDMDVVAVSAWNRWEKNDAYSMVWFENDGRMRFQTHNLVRTPTHLLAVEAFDFDGDGRTDFITAGMNVYAPYTHLSRVLLWSNRWGDPRWEQAGH